MRRSVPALGDWSSDSSPSAYVCEMTYAEDDQEHAAAVLVDLLVDVQHALHLRMCLGRQPRPRAAPPTRASTPPAPRSPEGLPYVPPAPSHPLFSRRGRRGVL
ncbi:hypothetical protein ACWDG1_30385 [Streptomyces sp. NPDC001177]